MLDGQESEPAERTRPEALSELRASYRREELVLTIVFHPEPGRIGETAVVPPARADRPEVIGRLRPLFGRPGEGGRERPLEDPHVSRVALEAGRQGRSLLLRRGGTGARVQVDGCQLGDSVALEDEQLRRGVPLLLGHSVVLLLRLGARAEASHAGAVPSLLGSSAYSCALRRLVLAAARGGDDVLILGETGTGKELVAGAIHSAGGAPGPLVSVNMAAIPPALAPAELFGAARGAFTGADRARTGYFRQARDGTLFLDEIGASDAEIQPQLLRALQQREVQVVGGTLETVALRVVSATDAQLDDDEAGFSAALRHRLGALEIQLLPLREHLEDVGELLWHFLAEALRARGRDGLLPGADSQPREIATWADLFHRCLRYRWPGNVRELSNRARQIALASEQRLTLPDHLYQVLRRGAGAPPDPERPAPEARRRMRDIGADEFLAAWREAGFEPTAAARLLGVSRQAVYRRVRSLGLRLASELPAGDIQRGLEAAGGDVAALAGRLEVSLAGLRTRLLQLGIGPGSG